MKDINKFDIFNELYGYSTTIEDEQLHKEVIKAIEEEDTLPYTTNLYATKRTDWDIHRKPQFKKLKETIENVLKQLTIDLYGFKNKKTFPKVDEMWGIIYEDGDFARVHSHYPCLWSGVYYPEGNDKSGKLGFPSLGVEVTPKKGLVVIFPGTLYHYVERMFGDSKRMAVAFNAGFNVQTVSYKGLVYDLHNDKERHEADS
tara:strand:+ start:61 stop:663 length:603 start_codon:yes stop_codon:yes gene_type:complete